jgi:hypothetical protein
MSTQQNNSALRAKPGMGLGFLPRRKGLAGIVTLLMGASLVFSGSASAHNIELATAREMARDFARAIRAQSNGKFKHYSTNCVSAFPGHNHIVRCLVEYQSAKDADRGVYTCKESLEVFLHSHKHGESYIMKVRHTSGNICGPKQPDVDYVHFKGAR